MIGENKLRPVTLRCENNSIYTAMEVISDLFEDQEPGRVNPLKCIL